MATAAAKAMLSKSNDDGVSVYSHLTEVLATMLESKPADPLSALEAISTSVKASYYKPNAAPAGPPPTSVADAASSDAWQTASDKLLKAPTAEEAEAEGELEGASTPDLLNEMQILEWAGVGLSREETMRVYTSLVKLQLSKKLATVRFFGKVLGTEADYYVAEAKYSEPPEAAEEEGGAAAPPLVPLEESGTGCNACVYFVTNDPASEWSVLPDVTPAQVSASRLIRKYLTGALDAPVRAFPPFPGVEMHYLRAQIARVVHATVLCPKGKYVLEGEEGEAKTVVENTDEEFVPLSGAAMKTLSNWCTYYMGILGIGRTTNPPAPEEEEEEGEAKPKGPAPEAEMPALSPVASADWALQVIPRMGGQPVTMVRSARWPGAVAAAVMKDDKFVNMYIGYGHEALDGPFVPMAPPPIETEPDELPEQTDPSLADENAKIKEAAEKKLAEAAAEGEEE